MFNQSVMLCAYMHLFNNDMLAHAIAVKCQ